MTFTLDRGPHESPGRGGCAAEATALLAREPYGIESAVLSNLHAEWSESGFRACEAVLINLQRRMAP